MKCCVDCRERKLHCHENCESYKRATFVYKMFKNIERKKKEEDMLLGVKSIERHIKWQMKRAYR